MTLKLADRIKETTTTTGTGALTLGGAMTGFAAFSSALSNADTCYYALQAVDANGNPTGAWEVGVGTYASSGNTLARTLIASSTGSLINLAAGTTQVWIDIAASRVVATSAAPSAGQVPVLAAGGLYASTAFALASLTDTNVVSPAAANLLRYNGGKWWNAAATLGSTGASTTLDPSVVPSNITLSNGNLTATGTSGWNWSRAQNPRTTGKYYAECYINVIAYGVGIGLANSAESTANSVTLGNDTNGVMFFNAPTVPGAGIFYNGAIQSGSTPSTPPTTGDTMGIAVDLGAQKVWFYNPETKEWNNDVLANQNPATGTGGFSIATIMSGGTGAIYLGVATQQVGSGTLNVGASAFVNPVPAGFSTWDTTATLADTNVSMTPNDGDMLVYSAVAGKWQNVPAHGDASSGFVDGNFDFWDTATSFSLTTTTDTYTATMWICQPGTSGAATVSQNTRTLGSEPAYLTRPSKYRMSYQQTSAAGSTNPTIGQKLEGVGQYNGQSITVQFSLAAAAALASGVVGVQYTQNFGTGGSPSTTVTGSTTVAWSLSTTEQKYSALLTIPSISGKTLGTNGNDFLRIDLLLARGVTYTIYVSQAQIDVSLPTVSTNTTGTGGRPMPFRYAGIGPELVRVQRHYEKSYNTGTAPGAVTVTGAVECYFSGPAALNACTVPMHFRATKRATPAMTFYSPITGASGYLRDGVNNADSAVTLQFSGMNSAMPSAIMGTVNNYINMFGHFTADARL